MHRTVTRAGALAIALGLFSLAACAENEAADAVTEIATDDAPRVEPRALERFAGDWRGALTYLNYQEPFDYFTIPAEATVSVDGDKVTIAYRYPDEPRQNGESTARLSKDGRAFDGQPIVSATATDDAYAFVTRYACEDMGKKATCEMTYRAGAADLYIGKRVTYADGGDPFLRNEYRLAR